MHRIIVSGPTYGSNQPVRLSINGQTKEFPVNVETSVSDDELAALKDSDHAITILEGDAAADEADQAPAPAGSGDGGDAGGGGGAGDPATETPDPAAAVLPPEFLDRSVTAIVADLASLDAAQLARAKADEETGKTRKSLIAAIDEAIAAKAAA